MAEVANFCRERQAVSHKTESVPQVALLLPSASIYDNTDRLFGPWGALLNPVHGVLHALLELHYSVDVLAEHQLIKKLAEYPVVVLPECHLLPEDFRNALLDYVKNGGQLLVIGADTVKLFKDELGVIFDGEPTEITAYVESDGALAWLGGVWQAVTPTTAATVGKRYSTHDTRRETSCAATVNRYGKGLPVRCTQTGQVAAIYGPLGNVHQRSHYPVVRKFLGNVMQRLFPEPLVTVDALSCIDVSLRRSGDKLLIHLSNMAGMQVASHYAVIDFIPSIIPVELTVRLDEKPKEVTLVPDDQEIASDWSDGKLKIVLPELNIHNVIVIQ